MKHDHIISGDCEQIAALDIQHYASRMGWGGVDTVTQQRVRFRDTLREAVVQKRGPVWFAVAHDSDGHPHCVGPSPSRAIAARKAVEDSKTTGNARPKGRVFCAQHHPLRV